MAASMPVKLRETLDFKMNDGVDLSVCKFCQKASQYTCPRCNVRYCSSDCYKRPEHMRCSEAFYRECVTERLKECHSSSEEKNRMQEILKRLEQDVPLDSDNDEDDVEDLEDRLQGLDLDEDTDEVWDRLTDRERREFMDMVRDGQLAENVEIWQPWWTEKKTLVEDLKPENKDCSRIPPVMKNVAQISDLLRGSASESVPFAVINVLYGYIYVTRIHNGGHLEVPAQASEDILHISECLSTASCSSAGTALLSAIERVRQSKSLYQSEEFSLAIIKDVEVMVQRSSEVMLPALSDLHQMITSARKLLPKAKKETKQEGHPGDSSSQGQRKKLFAASKKVEFLFSWTRTYGHTLKNLLLDIEIEFCSLSSDLATQRATQEKVEKSLSKLRPGQAKKLIEEI